MKPHKHAELIKAWADGAKIQIQRLDAHIDIVTKTASFKWVDVEKPNWSETAKYRIKPEEKKPVVRWIWAWHNLQSWTLTNFYTEDELAQQGYDVSGMICLEFTRTEFPK